jgi:hypothetical protein
MIVGALRENLEVSGGRSGAVGGQAVLFIKSLFLPLAI